MGFFDPLWTKLSFRFVFGQNFRFVLGDLSPFHCSIPRGRFASYHHTKPFSATKPLPLCQILRDLLTTVYLTEELYSHQYPPHAHSPLSHMHTGSWFFFTTNFLAVADSSIYTFLST